jgi:hypothetical protein
LRRRGGPSQRDGAERATVSCRSTCWRRWMRIPPRSVAEMAAALAQRGCAAGRVLCTMLRKPRKRERNLQRDDGNAGIDAFRQSFPLKRRAGREARPNRQLRRDFTEGAICRKRPSTGHSAADLAVKPRVHSRSRRDARRRHAVAAGVRFSLLDDLRSDCWSLVEGAARVRG